MVGRWKEGVFKGIDEARLAKYIYNAFEKVLGQQLGRREILPCLLAIEMLHADGHVDTKSKNCLLSKHSWKNHVLDQDWDNVWEFAKLLSVATGLKKRYSENPNAVRKKLENITRDIQNVSMTETNVV